MSNQDIEKDYEVYKHLLNLWASENPIKTNKLQVLLVVNGLLVTAVNISGGFIVKNWPIYMGGAILSLIWVLSIGRTSLFQKIWQVKIKELAKRHAGDSRFQVLEARKETLEKMEKTDKFLMIVGGVSSKYYLIGAPFVFCLGWLAIFLFLAL